MAELELHPHGEEPIRDPCKEAAAFRSRCGRAGKPHGFLDIGMHVTTWYLILGGLLIAIAVGSATIRRLPLTTSIVYLLLGYLLGPKGVGLFDLHPLDDAALLERITEIAVIVSLFSAGLKLRPKLRHPAWRAPLRLAFVSMALSVAFVAFIGVSMFGLSLGVAIILGAVLAPTDPVLASDVQLAHPDDRDPLRFTLTGEAGFNDGTAFPFIMLGLGLMGLHELGASGWRWVLVDVLWAILGGLAIGTLLGRGVGMLIAALRRRRGAEAILDEFLALGLIALAYGAALLCHTYGFLAVFAAGVALRHAPSEEDARATAADGPPPEPTAHSLLSFNEQLERLAEVGVVILVGGMLSIDYLPIELAWFVPFLFLFVRPLSVGIGLAGEPIPRATQLLMGWFGIRGIGSLYYLMYAINHGLPEEEAAKVAALTLSVVAASVVLHGMSVTPLMRWYEQQTGGEVS